MGVKNELKKNKKHTLRQELLNQQIENDAMKASQIDGSLITGYKKFYCTRIKRLIDVMLAVVIVIVTSPVFLIVSVAILFEDGFPILYRAERGGYKGQTFRICKFRSMIKNADRMGGGTTALNDNRITRVGNVIRKMKIDEFPNVLNVLIGEMSFIGPRPELLQYTSQYNGAERFILEVRPGMTDYSSVEFVNLDEIVGNENADKIYEKYVLPRKNKLRVKYVANVSFGTDMKIFAVTMWKVIKKSCSFIMIKLLRG